MNLKTQTCLRPNYFGSVQRSLYVLIYTLYLTFLPLLIAPRVVYLLTGKQLP